MKTSIIAGLGLAAVAIGTSGAATAQYYRNDDRAPSYERSERYDRGYRGDDRERGRGRDDYGARRDDSRDRGRGGDEYGARRGAYERDDGRRGTDFGATPRRADPMAGMSIEDQKRAIKNHREAQKKALRNGVIIP